MRRYSLVFILITLLAAILAACGGSQSAGGAPKAVEAYLQALVALDANKLVSLSCAKWEEQARMEADSFQAVTPKLDAVACTETGKDGDAALVTCQGKILATYNNENQEIKLDARTYRVVQEGGEWRMCGYK